MPKIKCNVSKCFNNKDGECNLKEIDLMMNNGDIRSLECLDCETQEDIDMFKSLKGFFSSDY